MKTRCLITGADGFIFSNVLKSYLEVTDWEFTCLCSWRHKGCPLNLQFANSNPRVTVISHDLTGELPDLGYFDYIINGASESHVDRSNVDSVNFIENNISLMLQVLEYARRYPPKVLLQFSTDEVYGAMAHKEWDVMMPSSPYAASKACQELICIAYWKTHKVPVVITNSNNVVGPNQNPEKFVPKVIQQIKNNEEITIHTANGMPARRHWNPVENIADALLFILEKTPSMYPDADRPDKYGLGGGHELDVLEMAQLLAKILNLPLKYHLLDGEAVRAGIDASYPKTEGTLEALGWSAPVTLEEGLRWIGQ
jgi:dTDP-glucose 4,6-dehydratase